MDVALLVHPRIELAVVVVVEIDLVGIPIDVGLQVEGLALLHEEGGAPATELDQVGGIAGHHLGQHALAQVHAARLGQELDLDVGVVGLELGIELRPQLLDAFRFLKLAGLVAQVHHFGGGTRPRGGIIGGRRTGGNCQAGRTQGGKPDELSSAYFLHGSPPYNNDTPDAARGPVAQETIRLEYSTP